MTGREETDIVRSVQRGTYGAANRRFRPIPFCGLAAAVATAAILFSASPAVAQYFGSNKVQFREFDFQVLTTPHFDIYYYPEQEQAVQLAARMAERWYARLSLVLDHRLQGRQPLILYAAHPHFQQTNVTSGPIGEATGGFTEGLKRRIVMPFAGGLAETDHVLGHELVHAFQFDIAEQTGRAGAMMALPLWFVEGMAEYLALGRTDAHTAMWVREASFLERMPAVGELDSPRFFPYRYGHAFWAYVAGRWGDAAVGRLFSAALASGSTEAAIETALGVDEGSLTRDWHEATRRMYEPWLETTRGAGEFAEPVVSGARSSGDVNVAPAISRDGRRVVFLSDRSLFSIDMYVADVDSGRVTRRIVTTAADPHFDSLQFLRSAGTWAPDNRRLMFAALSAGRPVLTIIDVDTGRVERERTFPEFGEIFNPAWSPNGRQVAFSALTGGLLDLHLYDLETDTVRALTRDPFAELDPAWSPDGGQIAFATDRFTSDLKSLAFGEYRLGLVQVTTGQIRHLPAFETGRQSRPQWGEDGTALYFVGTPDGIANVYRMDLGERSTDTGSITRLTNLRSGVSGITPLTPALSVAATVPRMVFTVFGQNAYDLYRADVRAQASPSVLLRSESSRDAAWLPPNTALPSEVTSLLADPARGLPEATTHQSRPYQARLSLAAVGPPTLGIGADRFGAYGAGGVSLLFTDMLGEHALGTTIQVTSRLEEFGGVATYLNKRARWNWGIIADQTPLVSGSFAQALGVVEGQPVIVQQEHRIVQTNRAAAGVVQYPFSRAQRLEAIAGIRTLSVSQRVDSRVFSALSGQLLDEQRDDLPGQGRLTFGEASAALVYDWSVAGATAPIVGQRYRFEYTQVAGALQYGGVLGDFRRYLMPLRPFTIGLRAIHYGRYGRDSEDPRLPPLFLGDPGLVRGYQVQSFTAAECPVAGQGCRVFDRLLGSRIAVANVEFRFPLAGLFTRRTFYGPLPVDVAVFGDLGAAWSSEARPSLAEPERLARSVGVAVRVNAFGYAVGELAYVRPLDRPGRGWLWQFNLTPGF